VKGGQYIIVFLKRKVGTDACWLLCAQYIDYVGSWGPAIVGHAHPEVTAALAEQIKKVNIPACSR
jgi:adenosylmethionine-8-amino-7-oxononanoate aminotransferase